MRREREGSKLDVNARAVMIALYKKLMALGLWRHIRSVGGSLTRGAGGASFVTHDNQAFFEDLIRSGGFCQDTRTGGMLHRGVISLREVTSGPALHLTLEPDDRITAHLDKSSPVVSAKAGGHCRYERSVVAAHIRREVLPLAIKLIRPSAAEGMEARQARRELEEAQAAVDEALTAGHPEEAAEAAAKLGALLEGFEDHAAAQQAYRAAIASGHPEVAPAAAYSLGTLLEAKGDQA
ncbi:MAG: hypothetical protein ACRDJF_06140, partial [Actinomycetota bacterium]